MEGVVDALTAEHRQLLEEAVKRRDVYVPDIDVDSLPVPIFDLFPPLESKVVVPRQMGYRGPLALPNELADVACQSLGKKGLLAELNRIQGTSYDLEIDSLEARLETCVSEGLDFGTAYSYMRPLWAQQNFERLDFSIEIDLSELNFYKMAAQTARMIGRRDRSVYTDPFGVMNYIPPRRVWDLYSNRVVDYAVVELWPNTSELVWRVSHPWVHSNRRHTVMTLINNFRWPVPVPVDVDLEQVRIELLNCGAQYAWLDVLCLRQVGEDEDEEERHEEWKVDVPTIGFIYSPPHRSERPEEYGPIVCYFNGLGWPFVLEEGTLDDHRHWLNRAWTLQEHKHDMLTLGLTEESPTPEERDNEVVRRFYERLEILPFHPPSNIFTVLHAMQPRAAANPTDKVFGLIYFLVTPRYPHGVPAYLEEEDVEDAWLRVLSAMEQRYRLDLLFLFPAAGTGKVAWAPSWQQAMNSDFTTLLDTPTADYQHSTFFHDRVSKFVSGLPESVSEALPDFLTDLDDGLLSRGLLNFVSERHVKKIMDRTGEVFARGYAVAGCFVRGLADVPQGDRQRTGSVRMQGRNLVVHAAHREPIPEGEYVMVGRDGPASDVWVLGTLSRQDRRLFSGTTLWVRKVSILQMPRSSGENLQRFDPGEVTSLRFD
ncbi:hypothetical protein PsYK624_108690 [Phanerochaete sordida]|uniref:Heterokaryon incompatibility domain-containing protein n=1 Tax=Phanerochaete sordida TaxID=48140 RepID=A0A9P3GEQ4_9APHY|nr:hypothetical protein PsYK624_108690 [Phanerochaete sordida]